ncbi:hypothetical protein IHE44_0011088 [Lamprotornis superbus]|uniref:OCEL domain-containing protein n=1 Tax=Lamprotornis superbus TaxID=245042 RepID=A0A835NDM6_9PASS|nr:hypothetical protein IHE44_0011088 [Lamprotornis superbus]
MHVAPSVLNDEFNRATQILLRPKASEVSHIGDVQVAKLYNPLGDVKRAQPNSSHPAPEEKKAMAMKPADSEGNPCTAVYRRPYRDRVIHLLALRTYKKPELLARLQRDGVMQKDKGTLGKILQQVANLNLKGNSFSLKEHLLQTLQADWPGYSEIDRENLKLILARKSAPSQNSISTSQVTSPGPSERDAPARPAQKRPLASDFASPVMSKKRRIGHQQFTSHVQPAAGGLSSSWVLPSTSLLTLNMSPSVGSISPCTPEVQQKEKFQSSSVPEPAMVQKEIPNSNGKKNELGRLKQKYIAIVSLEQHQHYKDDFNAEYEEYRNLHSQIDKINKDFILFHEQWKSLIPGSEAYQGSPSYSEMKSRCQYLHKKLSHIQSGISEFDKQFHDELEYARLFMISACQQIPAANKKEGHILVLKKKEEKGKKEELI